MPHLNLVERHPNLGNPFTQRLVNSFDLSMMARAWTLQNVKHRLTLFLAEMSGRLTEELVSELVDCVDLSKVNAPKSSRFANRTLRPNHRSFLVSFICHRIFPTAD